MRARARFNGVELTYVAAIRNPSHKLPSESMGFRKAECSVYRYASRVPKNTLICIRYDLVSAQPCGSLSPHRFPYIHFSITSSRRRLSEREQILNKLITRSRALQCSRYSCTRRQIIADIEDSTLFPGRKISGLSPFHLRFLARILGAPRVTLYVCIYIYAIVFSVAALARPWNRGA